MGFPPLRFSVCLETIFRDKLFEQRLEYIKDLGFNAFEFWDRQGKDMNITLALKMALRLECSAILGNTVSLIDPTTRRDALSEITKAAALAVDLSCEHLIIHSGAAPSEWSYDQQHQGLLDGLREAAEIAADADVTLVLEPLNRYDFPENFLWSSDEAVEMIDALGSSQVRLCFDIYHQQISEGNLSHRLTEYLPYIGYIQAGDVPGRHEPGTGEINYEHIFALLRERGYNGYVSLEYEPQVDSAASLKAVRALSQ